jgi:hypothetical protein
MKPLKKNLSLLIIYFIKGGNKHFYLYSLSRHKKYYKFRVAMGI